MSGKGRNLPASVHDRLYNRAQERGEDFQFILHRYAAERFLYRLGESRYRDRLVLKGAMLFALSGGQVYRPTRDLDFTGYGSSEIADVVRLFQEICAVAVVDDGLIFDPATVTAESIRGNEEYDGLRMRFLANLGKSVVPMQVDVGFGNAIQPPPNEVEFPPLLDSPAPRVRAYPLEAVVAEKMHAMVRLGEINSRLKDFYDLYVMSRQFPFGGKSLTDAIAATFERRRTPIDAAQPVALAPRFFADTARAAQWRTYLSRNSLPNAPADFSAVGEQIRAFLGPLWGALAEHMAFASYWPPGGPWKVAA
jgi:hypothetical protein